MSSLILIMGDQLSHGLSCLKEGDRDSDVILMAELRAETDIVNHHKKKIAFLFSAMRHFNAELRETGWRTDYIYLDDADNSQSFTGEIGRAIARHKPRRILLTSPSEYRVLAMAQGWARHFGLPVDIIDDDRFYCTPQSFSDWAQGRKQLRMEYFYRDLRRRTGILMNGTEPVGGEWNYDSENRAPPGKEMLIPAPARFHPDSITAEVITLVEQHFPDHYGDLHPFDFAVTSEQAKDVLHQFIDQRLAQFGRYQDAMLADEPFMYHAHISFYLNCGLLLASEAVEAALGAWQNNTAPLNAVEGFIRQIIGWREYVRGLYWLKMPDYREMNYLQATRALPDFFWTGRTEMSCVRHCLSATHKYAYAHHIQRLMVLGNFCLLAGIDPDEVNEWYLCVYADAFEWVDLPNVTGMILFADGGILASKPYAAGASYINRMSDYCRDCHFNPKQKSGPDACPFGYLYWAFLGRNEARLRGNPRLGMIYRSWDKMSEADRKQLLDRAEQFLNNTAPKKEERIQG